MKSQNPITEIQEWTATLTESVTTSPVQILEQLPAVPGTVVLLLVGWGVAATVYAIQQRSSPEKTVVRLAHTRPMDIRVQQPRSYSAAPTIASRIVFWVVLLFF